MGGSEGNCPDPVGMVPETTVAGWWQLAGLGPRGVEYLCLRQN
jgi:hypothetical protein